MAIRRTGRIAPPCSDYHASVIGEPSQPEPIVIQICRSRQAGFAQKRP